MTRDNSIKSKIKALKLRLKGGLLPAMATPLEEDGYTVNEAVVDHLVNFLVDHKIAGLFVGGTTGEGILLQIEQRKILHARAIRATDGRVPVLIHVGANTLSESIELTRHAQEFGADGIVAVTPYFYGLHDSALLQYFSAVAQEASEIPFFVYEIPHLAVNRVSPSLLAQVAEVIPNFAGIKSSNTNAQEVRALIDETPADSIFLVGNERIALGTLALGADGHISGLATAVPEPFVAMLQAFSTGDISAARRSQQTINEILQYIANGARIGAIKSLLNQRGILVGPPVPPRPPADSDWQVWKEISKQI
jgi:dihydrodipicolinate synthase/N-acetylneuraminate lyase